MPLTHSHKPGDDALRTARTCVLNGQPIPMLVAETLTARGIDVSDLEHRFIMQQEFRN